MHAITPQANFVFLQAPQPDLYQPAHKAERHAWDASWLSVFSRCIAFRSVSRACATTSPSQPLNWMPWSISSSPASGSAADVSAEIGLPATLFLGEFIRSILGLDVHAAKEAFAGFVSTRARSTDQINFVNSLIDYLVVNGNVAQKQLFECLFTERHHEGMVGVFRNETQLGELLAVVGQISRNARAVA